MRNAQIIADLQRRCKENAEFLRRNSFERTIVEQTQQQVKKQLEAQKAMRG